MIASIAKALCDSTSVENYNNKVIGKWSGFGTLRIPVFGFATSRPSSEFLRVSNDEPLNNIIGDYFNILSSPIIRNSDGVHVDFPRQWTGNNSTVKIESFDDPSSNYPSFSSLVRKFSFDKYIDIVPWGEGSFSYGLKSFLLNIAESYEQKMNEGRSLILLEEVRNRYFTAISNEVLIQL